MLISHPYKFIFVHVYKNAGTSIAAALLPFSVYNRVHLSAIKLADRFNLPIPEALNPHPMTGHVNAQQIINKLGQKKFDEYFSFAFVRNPWDWQVSIYNFARQNPDHRQYDFIKQFATFEDYLRWRCAEEVRFQKDFIYSLDGRQLVKFIGRYENLEEDFGAICDRIGIRASLPRMRVSKTRPYQEFYTIESSELIRKTFAPDIELFGYNFE